MVGILRFSLISIFLFPLSLLAKDQPYNLPDCLNPVIPEKFINIKHLNDTLSLVFEARLCRITISSTNLTRVFFKMVKSAFGGASTTPELPSFYPYDFLGWENPHCTVHIHVKNRGSIDQPYDPDGQFFIDHEIVIKFNVTDRKLVMWNCSLFPRDEYESEITSAVSNLIHSDTTIDKTVPFLDINPSDSDQNPVQVASIFLFIGVVVVIIVLLIVINLKK